MRSRPANASVICVPIDAIETSGAATRPIEEDVHDQIAERHLAGEDGAAAEPDHQHADDADDHRAAGGRRRHAGHRLGDVAEQPVRALGEDDLLALLRGVGLDDADAAERFGEPAGDLGVDLAALAEQRPQRAERVGHAAAEDGQHQDRDDGQVPVQPEQHGRCRCAAVTKPPTSCTRPVPTRLRMPFGVAS